MSNTSSSYWDKYKSSHEPEDHWNLRKKFLEMHKDKFNEDRLICLAQVFYNVEFLGCKYPDKVMKTIEELSVGVVEDHHAQKKQKIQRTFVAASDAAESKVTRTGVKRKNEDTEQKTKEEPSGYSIRDIVMGDAETSFVNQKINSYMNRNPPISNLILVMMKDELTKEVSPETFQMLQRSGQFSNLYVRLNQLSVKGSNNKKWVYSFDVALKTGSNPRGYVPVVSIETNEDIVNKNKRKELTKILLEKTYQKLCKEHFTIVIHNKFYSTQDNIEKKRNEMKQSGQDSSDKTSEMKQEEEETEYVTEEMIEEIDEMESQFNVRKFKPKKRKTPPVEEPKPSFISDSFEKIAEDNLGSKLLKLMGWSGSGGLGKNEQGRAEPVPITGRLDRKRVGLGTGMDKAESSIHKVLQGEDGESKFGLNVVRQEHMAHPQFKLWARDLLEEYLNNTKLLWFEDLIFSTSFTKEERKFIHTLTQSRQFKIDLQAKSYGKDDNRHLVVSKKLNKNGISILYDLINCGDNPKFSLIIPDSFNTYME